MKPWNKIVGHDSIYQRFNRSVAADRLANTYLFAGVDGIGKKLFALALAQSLFCQNRNSTDPLSFCGTCSSCIQMASGSHPDLIRVAKPADKNFIPVELFVGDREHRRQKGLCHDIHLTPFSADRKIAIIDDADFLNAESANSLLKTLEEPPANSILILIGTSEHRQLPTILSRTQVVRFSALSIEQVREILSDCELQGEVDLNQLADVSAGSVQQAIRLDHQETFELRQRLIDQLCTLDPASQFFSKTICDFVDATSKEGSVRRQNLRWLGDYSIQFLEQVMHALHLNSRNHHESSAAKLEQAIARINGDSDQIIPAWIERTIRFQSQIDANMATANIVPSWLNDLGRIARQEILAIS